VKILSLAKSMKFLSSGKPVGSMITAQELVFRFGCRRQQKRHAAAPPPAGVQRRMERNRQKLVGGDKGSLTAQQTKGTVMTTIQMRRKHNTNRTTQRAALPTELPLCPPEPRVSSPRPALPHRNPA